MTEIIPYSPQLKSVWDTAVGESRNGLFQHMRDYMDYHADRFTDCSVLAADAKGRIIAVLPAHASGDDVSSHRGLTFGGWLMTQRADMPAMMEVWTAMTDYYRKRGFRSLYYRPAPYIYHKYPADEDIYALFRAGGVLDAVQVSSVVDNSCPHGFDMASRQSVRKAAAAGIGAGESARWAEFWQILSGRLQERYDARPVHTLDEILLLHSRFPEQIRLFTATLEGRIIAGVVIYDCGTAVHSQYCASTDEGRRLRALPLLYRHILDACAVSRFFDFGTSNEDGGRILNEGLIRQKCGFGGRAVAYNAYMVRF